MKFLFIILTIFIFLQKAGASECERQYSSLVFAENNHEIIFEKRGEEIIYPASLTKVMTLYLVFEALEKHRLELDGEITISANAEDISKVNKINTLNLKEGEKINVDDAIKGTAIKSFNEAAVALAEAVAGDEINFAKMMNQKAFELNMMHTNFRNASGLHDAGQYTTAYDLARLVEALEKNFSQYRKYFAAKKFTFRGNKYETHNHVLLEYEGADGFKTGYTAASGYNLIASAKRGDVRVKSILTGCETYKKRDEYTKNLLDLAFKEIDRKKSDVIITLK